MKNIILIIALIFSTYLKSQNLGYFKQLGKRDSTYNHDKKYNGNEADEYSAKSIDKTNEYWKYDNSNPNMKFSYQYYAGICKEVRIVTTMNTKEDKLLWDYKNSILPKNKIQVPYEKGKFDAGELRTNYTIYKGYTIGRTYDDYTMRNKPDNIEYHLSIDSETIINKLNPKK